MKQILWSEEGKSKMKLAQETLEDIDWYGGGKVGHLPASFHLVSLLNQPILFVKGIIPQALKEGGPASPSS